MNLSSLKGSVFWVVIYAKKTNKITKNLILGLSLLLKIVEKNWKISRGFGLFSFNFFNFFKNYLGYLKIKEAADTLGMVCFCCNVKPFGWYVSAKNGIVKVPPLFSMVFERFSLFFCYVFGPFSKAGNFQLPNTRLNYYSFYDNRMHNLL